MSFAKFCHSHGSPVVRKPKHCLMKSYFENNLINWNDTHTMSSVARGDTGKSSDPRLCQLKNTASTQTPWKMAVISSQARQGNILCWIGDLQKAVVVRPKRSNNGRTWSIAAPLHRKCTFEPDGRGLNCEYKGRVSLRKTWLQK